MARKSNSWLSDIAEDVKLRKRSVVGMAAGRVASGFKPPKPPELPPVNLQGFMEADPQMRHQFLAALTPDEFTKVQDQLSKEAVDKYGPMAAVLGPMFNQEQLLQAQSNMEQAQVDGGDANMGVDDARGNLAQFLGFDPFDQSGQQQ